MRFYVVTPVFLALVNSICFAGDSLMSISDARCSCNETGVRVNFSIVASEPVILNLRPLQIVTFNRPVVENAYDLPNYLLLTDRADWSGRLYIHADGRLPTISRSDLRELNLRATDEIPMEAHLPVFDDGIIGYIALSFQRAKVDFPKSTVITGLGDEGVAKPPVKISVIMNPDDRFFMAFRGEGRLIIGPIVCSPDVGDATDQCEVREEATLDE